MFATYEPSEPSYLVVLRTISLAMRAYILLAVPIWIGLLMLIDRLSRYHY